MQAHIPPGREAMWRRQAEADAEVARLDAACGAAERKARELAKVFDPDDAIVEDADEEFARLFDERNQALAVANRVYQESHAGLSSWIDHDPTAPVCTGCGGTGGPPGADAHGACKGCRGWGREYRPPIPVWHDGDDRHSAGWYDPATGHRVDLLADEPPKPAPLIPTQPTAAPIPTGSAGSSGAGMSIEQVRAGIAASNEASTEALGALQQALASLETAQGALMAATEGSGQADVSEANGLLAQAVSSVDEVRQQVSAAISSAEGVGNRL